MAPVRVIKYIISEEVKQVVHAKLSIIGYLSDYGWDSPLHKGSVNHFYDFWIQTLHNLFDFWIQKLGLSIFANSGSRNCNFLKISGCRNRSISAVSEWLCFQHIQASETKYNHIQTYTSIYQIDFLLKR